MPHARKLIRDAVIAALTGLATTGSRVYAGRTRPLGETYQPTLLVYATDEVSEIDAMGSPPTLARTLSLVIDGRAQETTSDALDDLLDQIQLEVEPAMVAQALLTATNAVEITLISTRIAAVAPGANHQGDIRMEYRIRYRTKENAPATAV